MIFRADTLDQYWSMVHHTVDGQVNGGTCRWVETDVNPSCNPPSDVEIGKLTNEEALEFYRVTFSVREAGW